MVGVARLSLTRPECIVQSQLLKAEKENHEIAFLVESHVDQINPYSVRLVKEGKLCSIRTQCASTPALMALAASRSGGQDYLWRPEPICKRQILTVPEPFPSLNAAFFPFR